MTLWIATCEVSLKPGDIESGRTLAFTNIVTWGQDNEGALENIRAYFAEYRWTLIECETIKPVEDGKDYGDELNDLIERAAGNPNAVIYGTFHTYKPN